VTTKRFDLYTEGPVAKQLFWMTLPMIGGMLTNVLYNLADTLFVGHLGEQGWDSVIDPGYGKVALAAMGCTFSVVVFCGSFGMGINTGLSSVLSRIIGGGDPHRPRQVATDGLILSVLASVMLTVIGLATIDPVFALLKTPAEAMPVIRTYMTIWYYGLATMLIPRVANAALRAAGDTITPSVVMIAGAILNVGLDYLLIFGHWGLPRMGVAGAAWATVISRGLVAIYALWALRKKGLLTFEFPRLRVLRESWGKILYVGIPSTLTTLMFPISIGAVTRLLNSHSTNPNPVLASAENLSAVAAQAAGMRVEALVMMALWALHTTVGPFVGQNFGAGKMDRVRRAKNAAMWFSLAWGGFCCLLAFAFAGHIAPIFRPETDIQEIMTNYLWIIAIGLGFRSMNFMGAAIYNAMNFPGRAAAVDLIRLLVLYIPLAWLGRYFFGLYGIFWGLTAANVIGGLATAAILTHLPEPPDNATN
jgi:putative MATE family efflux protein